MKKILKWLGISLVALVAVLGIAGWIAHKPLPEGKTGPAAEQLARRMNEAVNSAAWDSTGAVRWNFQGMHDFFWDRSRHFCRITWGNKEVLLNLNTGKGIARKDGAELTGEQLDATLKKAHAFFFNDSFWLNAPVKVYDPGVTRMAVALPDGKTGLLAKFGKGGATPGDHYLWELDEDGLPRRWRMWVSILPVGGVAFEPAQWVDLPTGARIATRHRGSLFEVKINDLAGAAHWSDLEAEDPFAELTRSGVKPGN